MSFFDEDPPVMVTIIEWLCTRLGHQFPFVCAWIGRQDAWWRSYREADAEHRRLRAAYLRGMDRLPFPPAVEQLAGSDTAEPSERRFTRTA